MNVSAILTVIILGFQVEIPYDFYDDCARDLLKLATSDLNHSGDLYARCDPTGAPTVSLLPLARPEK